VSCQAPLELRLDFISLLAKGIGRRCPELPPVLPFSLQVPEVPQNPPPPVRLRPRQPPRRVLRELLVLQDPFTLLFPRPSAASSWSPPVTGASEGRSGWVFDPTDLVSAPADVASGPSRQ
jgi:hypothetical protein